MNRSTPSRNNRSGRLVTTLSGVVAMLCLWFGYHLLTSDSSDPIHLWLDDERLRSGLILALGGAFTVFLAGSGLLLAIRRAMDSPRRKVGGGAAPAPPQWVETDEIAPAPAATAHDQVLAKDVENLLKGARPLPESRQELDATVQRLNETVQDTEAILREIRQAAQPPDSDSDFPT